MPFKILSVVGARPDFMKVAALSEAITEYNGRAETPSITHILVHTGQHYDANMSDLFFNDLELPKPNLVLGVGSATHSAQTARILEGFERVLLVEKPDVVVVVGDVNSTLACALTTKKTWCIDNATREAFIPKLAHIEAGLRSFDRMMAEEINRIVTDSVSDMLFTSEESANGNLKREGVLESKIHFVGNVMIDTLLRCRAKAEDSNILNDLCLVDTGSVRRYALLTLHGPTNVDEPRRFSQILDSLLKISPQMPVIFPAHPRTLKQIQQADLGDYFVDHHLDKPDPWDSRVRIRLLPPLGYLDFLQLMSKATVVLTDSGAIQEETTILNIPCITLRSTTERLVTVTQGTNVLVDADPAAIVRCFEKAVHTRFGPRVPPPLWDGNAAKRIVTMLVREQNRGAGEALNAESALEAL
jgi:UDP-N-acetylglucosamine 2-epimerase (non-hydrolysing)